jgi:sterol 3beta-glucosyltransferase
MRVRIITSGAQGDVRPSVAFGVGLKAAGHDVRVIAHDAFESLIRKRGLDFAPLAGDPRELAKTGSQTLRGLHEGGRNPVTWLRAIINEEVPLMRRRLADAWQGCQDADVVVTSTLPYLFAYGVARKLGVPLVRAFYFPVSPTREHPIDGVPSWLRLGGRLNLATYGVQRQLIWQVARPWVASAYRDVLGISDTPYREPFGDLDRRRQLLLYGYSAAVAPPPRDWGSWQMVTGYWSLDRRVPWTPPPELATFLSSGPPPVCIGFGSMTFDRDELIGIVSQALEQSGQRGVFLTGWGDLRPNRVSANLITLDWAPPVRLFSQMAAVVHHGGAGTTADALRAGVPAVVVPFFYDQFFWAKRVHSLGASPHPIPRKQLTAARLADAIRVAVSDPEMRRCAQAVGERIEAEDGVTRAVEAFERYFGLAQGASAPAEPRGVSVTGRGIKDLPSC